jgi:hypothetical protein
VHACLQRGVNVLQLNLEDGLAMFGDNSFDVVLQIDTLQHLRNAETMLRETARVGRIGIVAFPNFAHWPNRLSVLQGRMPVTKRLPYQWYDTPNIRVGAAAPAWRSACARPACSPATACCCSCATTRATSKLLWGAWWAGLVVVPVNAKLHPREVEWIIDNAGARWGFVTRDVAPSPLAGLERQVDASPRGRCAARARGDWTRARVRRARPDDLAWLFYTSGTTGRPKGVMLTHRNLMTMGLTYFVDVDPVARPRHHRLRRADVARLRPVRHSAPDGRRAPRGAGLGRRRPGRAVCAGPALGPLSTFAAPTIVKRLVDHAEPRAWTPDRRARAFKTIVYGGAPMYVADIRRALR